MDIRLYYTREKTVAIRGIAALAIYIFHILLQLDITPLFNPWGGLFVAVFLVLSGYGINESYNNKGFSNYWSQRSSKVIIPTALFIICYSLLSPDNNLFTCISELLYIQPTYWFIFHVVKCYAAYWIARRYCGRYWMLFLITCAVLCLNYRFCDMQFESEQAFSFLSGIAMSEYKERINNISQKNIKLYVIALFIIGLLFYVIKSVTPIHEYIGTVTYNYFLCPFRLSWALVTIYILTHLNIERSTMLTFSGKKSLEIYVAHIPMIGMIHDLPTVGIFIAFSLISFTLLLLYTMYIQQRLSFAMTLFIAINSLFVAKYSERLTDLWPYITFVWIVVMCLFLIHILPWLLSMRKAYKAYVAVLAALFIAMIGIQYAIDPYSIQVDRWSALHYPIENMLHGIYPYIAQTHLGGNASPFPVWQVIHIPFYLIGNVGLSIFPALSFFLWTIYNRQGKTAFITSAMLLMVSPAIWYEVSVRSDLITNMLLLASVLNLTFHKLSVEWLNRHCTVIAICIALFAGTRLLTLLPFGILLLPYYFRMHTSKIVLMPLVFLCVFTAIFMPFALWDWQEFFHHANNPWALQTRQGSPLDFIIYIPLAIYLATQWKSGAKSYYRNTSIMIVCFVAISMLHRMYVSDNWNLFASAYDITYYSTAIPFAILSALTPSPHRA